MPGSHRLGLLNDRDFGRLFAATALGQLGDRIIFLTLPLVAIATLHADEFQVGLLTATTTAGSLLVGLPAGAWVDRMRKRTVLIGSDLLRAAALLTIPLAWWADLLSVRLLYAVALLHGVLTVFFDVAHVSYLPHLVGRDKLVEGNAKLSAIRSVTSIGGPAVAGPLVGLVGAPATLLASSAGMTMSGLFAATIRRREENPRPTSERPRLRTEITEGLRFVLHRPALRAIMISDALFNLSLVMYQTMLLVFLERTWAWGPSASDSFCRAWGAAPCWARWRPPRWRGGSDSARSSGWPRWSLARWPYSCRWRTRAGPSTGAPSGSPRSPWAASSAWWPSRASSSPSLRTGSWAGWPRRPGSSPRAAFRSAGSSAERPGPRSVRRRPCGSARPV
ncbi:hypothetical protein STPH2_5310 [Streptomyces sp. KO7888]|uniref:MFS transporter n=1 Tax=Streptomyces sp. KO7888 TaxID=2602737 RepID=UPI0019DF58AD|nr:MFS transporter [Streptomyces sp. KO7888]NHI09943.1 hypothetical protein [Streptomyces sp. KO7888]